MKKNSPKLFFAIITFKHIPLFDIEKNIFCKSNVSFFYIIIIIIVLHIIPSRFDGKTFQINKGVCKIVDNFLYLQLI